MADTTTELEVLDDIVDVLGGTSGQYETVVPTLRQIKELLGGGGAVPDGAVTFPKLSQDVQDAIEEGGSGYNPSLSVGRADALTGADSTAQWAQRESTGGGAATVRSVQGAVEVQDGELVPVQIAGIASTDAQGGELDAIEWTAQTLWGAGTIGDMLYSDHKVTKMATLDMGTLTWQKHATKAGVFYASMAQTGGKGVSGTSEAPNCRCTPYTAGSYNDVMGSLQFDNVYTYAYTTNYLYLKDTSKDSMTAAEFKESLSGVILVYELATPTTTPISPALPMTYRVQAGGSESIIVPDGEISAPPILTVAEGESAAELVMDALACIATPDGPTAASNHAQNTYLTMGGKLYKVTSAIAVGESIVAGTNVTQTTVMSELLALTA